MNKTSINPIAGYQGQILEYALEGEGSCIRVHPLPQCGMRLFCA